MNLTLDHLHIESKTLTVKAADEAMERARKAAAGWKYQYRVLRSDGSVELTFARRKVGAAEVNP